MGYFTSPEEIDKYIGEMFRVRPAILRSVRR